MFPLTITTNNNNERQQEEGGKKEERKRNTGVLLPSASLPVTSGLHHLGYQHLASKETSYTSHKCGRPVPHQDGWGGSVMTYDAIACG